MSPTLYLTTPIYYVNAEPHLGHAYTTVVGDVMARFHRLLGFDVRYQTGTDEHGDKIAEAAAAKGAEPQQYADRISALFQETWPKLSIQTDNFIRTTDPGHIAVVQAILQRVYDAGEIYFSRYGGNYCVACERFYTETEAPDAICPDHHKPLTWIEEENYFFRMSGYRDWLVGHIKANPDFIRPERYRNEVLAFLREPLEDLCISRPKSRLTWGITLPFDERFVTYVWFDALINYMSGLGWPDGEDFERYWPQVQHLVAKDILKPHAIFWPTMLAALGKAEGKEPEHYQYRHLNVHGYWNIEAAKMSKSLGNVVGPLELADLYGVDAFRYFLLREMRFGLDANFSQDALVERYNADLANDLGNLLSRVLGMLQRYRGGVIPGQAPDDPYLGIAELASEARPWEVAALVKKEVSELGFDRALAAVWGLIRAGNKIVVASQPWELAKDPDQSAHLDQVLFTLCRLLADVAVMIWPVMPTTAETMAQTLKLEPIGASLMERLLAGEPLITPGAQTLAPQALFPRVDTKKVQAKASKKAAKAAKETPPMKQSLPEEASTKGQISIEQFGQVDLRLGTVVQAAPIKGADKLLHLMVDLGEPVARSIVAGIAQHYQPAELVGRQVVVVANLKPAKLRGVESQGMVLAAVEGEQVRLVAPDRELPPGSKVR